jgi:shikimate kinase
MKVILLGYMASGKSTLVNYLAKKLNIHNIDLDDYIIEKEGDSIKNIFSKKGEIYFRKLENVHLKELISSKKNFALSLGGGTPCYANNMTLLEEIPNSFYLKANLNTLFERLRFEKENRPLISELNDDQLKEFIAKHLFERSPYYDMAKHTIIIDNKTTEMIAENILQLL